MLKDPRSLSSSLMIETLLSRRSQNSSMQNLQNLVVTTALIRPPSFVGR